MYIGHVTFQLFCNGQVTPQLFYIGQAIPQLFYIGHVTSPKCAILCDVTQKKCAVWPI